MVNIFLIHGAYGNPAENWLPWLKHNLEMLGHKVFIPKFPTPKNQNLENWKKVFKDYEKFVDKDSVFVGHSLGPAFILSFLENITMPIKASFFVSAFISEIGNPDFDVINSSFYKKFNWKKIKNNCRRFYLFHSDNDPYVPLKQGEDISKKLDSNLIIVKNAGHFNKESGYTRFPLLLEKIKKELR